MVKIISNKKYERLVKEAEGRIENPEVTRLREVLDDVAKANKEVEIRHKREIKELNLLMEEESTKTQKEINNMVEDQKIVLKRKEQEVENKLYEATKAIKEDNAKLKMELNNALKEVSILTKAFENLGFDVKDMKGILDKLVDGIVSKNTINVVK